VHAVVQYLLSLHSLIKVRVRARSVMRAQERKFKKEQLREGSKQVTKEERREGQREKVLKGNVSKRQRALNYCVHPTSLTIIMKIR
jgi:hypothetical protein